MKLVTLIITYVQGQTTVERKKNDMGIVKDLIIIIKVSKI